MYESFFNFTRTPFGRDLPPDQLFPSQDHLEALARLNWAVMQRGMALLTGDVGSGKSTCLRALRAALDPLRSRWLYPCSPLGGFTANCSSASAWSPVTTSQTP